jgi:NAD(P)-dependent dehydrogenase (short-subunit alcohol dehydrogenase family)
MDFRDKARRELRERIALVMGASKGLGLLIAHELGLAGARVHIAARDEEELNDATQWLQHRGVTAHAHSCDAGKRGDVHGVIAAIEASAGPIDVLVNNAGVIQVGPLANMTVEDFEAAMNTMFWGAVYPALEVLPGMKQRRWGRIATVTSFGGKVSAPYFVPYSSAKFAAVGFSEGLRSELAGTGVGAITVVPGIMRTGSYLNAIYKGPATRQYGLYAPLQNLPGFSVDGRAAARRIVRAIVNNEPEVTLTLGANLMQRFNGLFPGITTRLLALGARALPGPTPDPARRGDEIAPSVSDSKAFRVATTLGRNAVRDYQPTHAKRGNGLT